MLYKEDWEEAKERILAWWQGEIVDRVVMQVWAPRKAVDYPPPRDLEQMWSDPEYVIGRWKAWCEGTAFLGEAFPAFWPNLGPTIASAYLGCPLIFMPETTWQEPIIEDPSQYERIEFQSQNKWWNLTLEMITLACEQGKGEYLVGFTDLGGVGDILSHLRRPDRLCLDLLEDPEVVERAVKYLTDLWLRLYEEQYAIIRRYQEGTFGWLTLWAPGKSYPLQEDFSCMISPSMFRRFFLPELEAQTNYLDYSIYHLDGPGAIKHLDALLELPKLKAIQWVPGSGAPPMPYWIPLLKRIQEAGRNLVLDVSPSDVEPLLEHLSPKGMCLRIWCASLEEGEHLLKMGEEWTVRKAREGKA